MERTTIPTAGVAAMTQDEYMAFAAFSKCDLHENIADRAGLNVDARDLVVQVRSDV